MILTCVIFQSAEAWAVTSDSIEQAGPRIMCLVGSEYNISYMMLVALPASHCERKRMVFINPQIFIF